MERGAGWRPGASVEQRGGAGGHGAAALLQPRRRLLPRHLQPGRRDQPQAAHRRTWIQGKGEIQIAHYIGIDGYCIVHRYRNCCLYKRRQIIGLYYFNYYKNIDKYKTPSINH